MRLPQFEYLEPKTLKQAVKALMIDVKRSVLLAGGTDLIVHMKHRLIQPKRVINLKTIRGLASISDGKDGLKIGALTSLHDIASSPVIKERYPALAQAAEEVGAYAHQVMGTIGGNLCQGNRCRFYNQSPFWRGVRPPCYKAGGKVCHAMPKSTLSGASLPRLQRRGLALSIGSAKCHSTYCGDLAPVLMALDARIEVIGPDGGRVFPLKRLYTQDGQKPLSLRKGEILKEVAIPSPSGKTFYLKWRLRDSLEFPVVSLAIQMEPSGKDRIKKGRIIFSAVGPGPVEAVRAEKVLKAACLDDRMIEKISNQALKEISPVRTSIHSPAYKRKMAGILLRQALEQLQNEDLKSKIRNPNPEI